MIQFMKGKIDYGEVIATRHMKNITIRQFGRPGFVDKKKPQMDDILGAQQAIKHATGVMKSGEFDIVILDEVNVAVDFGLLKAKEVIDAVSKRKKGVEVILTGRKAPKEFLAIADYVVEVKDLKHPYKKGIKARKGIEF
jgi:cob(I)alamin adenosyltransferase